MADAPPRREWHVEIPATETAVRAALADMRAMLARSGLDDDTLGSVELVLAEVLNNICEHAYAGQAPGPVRLRATLGAARLSVCLRDRGRPLPGGTLPEGHLPDPTGPRGSLPEGGFGWFLIRDLTDSVTYSRDTGENRLDLHFSIRRAP